MDDKVTEYMNEDEESTPKLSPSLSNPIHDKPECSKARESMSEPSPRSIFQNPNEEVYKTMISYPQRLILPKNRPKWKKSNFFKQIEEILKILK